jgi:hypothetical protein
MIGFNGGLIGKNNPIVAGSSIPGMWTMREQEVAIRTSTWAGAKLLDLYPGAAYAYSLRLLRLAYTGPVVTVLRSSDNATINCNEREVVDGTLESFCSGTNGFVTTWYDQSLNANNATDAGVSARRPQIVSSGALITNGSPALPVLRFDGSSDYLTQASNNTVSQPFTSVMALKRTGGSGDQNIIRSGAGAVPYFSGNNLNVFAGSVATITSAPNDTRFIFSMVWNGALSASIFNGSTGTPNPSTTALTSGSVLTIGSAASIAFTTMDMHELIIYGSNQASSLADINTNVNTFYGVY